MYDLIEAIGDDLLFLFQEHLFAVDSRHRFAAQDDLFLLVAALFKHGFSLGPGFFLRVCNYAVAFDPGFVKGGFLSGLRFGQYGRRDSFDTHSFLHSCLGLVLRICYAGILSQIRIDTTKARMA